MSSKFDPVFDVKFLKTFIIEDPHALDRIWDQLPPREFIDAAYDEDVIVWLTSTHANLYNIRSMYISKPVKIKDFPHYNAVTKDIVLCGFPSETKSMKRMLYVFCHELAHHIQNKSVNHKSASLHKWLYAEFDRSLRYERTAERLAYFLYKKYFAFAFGDIHHSKFSAYKSKRHIKFLKSYIDLCKTKKGDKTCKN